MIRLEGLRVLVLGGAGFLGSHIVEHFVQAGSNVTVIDGLLPGTGGNGAFLEHVRSSINFIDRRIECVPEMADLLKECDLVVDSLAWTAHRSALSDPLRDLELNAASHLYLLRALPAKPLRFIYLGSRGQYGSSPGSVLTEESPLIPDDIQGIHKTAAESYYRVYSQLHDFSGISLRLPNCFGPRQPTSGSDIGLIGTLIRDLVNGQTPRLFGRGRMRPILFATDVAQATLLMAAEEFRGFQAYNFSGQDIAIEDLLAKLIEIMGRGFFEIADMPADVKLMESSARHYSDARIRTKFGLPAPAELTAALTCTVRYFEESLHDSTV